MRDRLLIIVISLLWGSMAQAADPALDISDCIKPGPDPARLYSGLGDTHFDAGFTGLDAVQAQRFFNQGLTYVYAFNKPEAVHSFLESARLQPENALPFWGIALAAGPDINTVPSAACLSLADGAIARAVDLSPEAGEVAQLVAALRARYVAGDPVTVDAAAYASAMRKVSANFPGNHHAATLFASALLNIERWKWWKDGVLTPEATEARATLLNVLALEPDHIGANHYFIHATEESPDPGEALPSADRMAKLAPGAGHIVHMPSHIYRRTGNHAAATAANYAAVAADRSYIGQAPDAARYPLRYLNHNLQFLTLSLIIEGRASESLSVAEQLFENTVAFTGLEFNQLHNQTIIASRDDFFFTIPIVAVIRNRAWENELNTILTSRFPEILSSYDFPIVEVFLAYSNALHRVHHGSGREELSEVIARFHEKVAAAPEGLGYDNNPASVIFRLANLDLLARAAEGLPDAARADLLALAATAMADIQALQPDAGVVSVAGKNPQIALMQRAVEIEDAMTYAEPPNWYYPMREGLGGVLFRAGAYKQAEAVFRDGLQRHRGYGRLIFGLIESLKAQDRPVPDWLDDAFAAAWSNAPLPLTMDDL